MSPEKKKAIQSGSKKKKISLIITVKNDAKALTRTLQAIEKQSLLPDEVIITVADSEDETLVVAKNWKVKGVFVLVIQIDQQTRSQGRNSGIKLAQGEILVLTDAGCIPVEGWLEWIVQPLLNSRSAVSSGYTTIKSNSAFEEAVEPFVIVSKENIPKNPLPATRNLAVLVEIFRQHGYFRDELNFAEDYELARRWRKQGVQSVFVPQAVVYWEPPSTLLAFFTMIQNLTRGDMLASTWRKGHASMWLRYVFFLAAGLLLYFVYASLWLATMTSISLWSLYLLAKLTRFSFARRKAYLWAILLHVLADIAVLSGTLLGLWQKKTRKAWIK